MPSIHDKKDRHCIIDQRENEYLCFPDVLVTPDGRILVAYNESDRHVNPSRRALRIRQSFDNGETWSAVQHLNETMSHCPRLAIRCSGEILLSDILEQFYSSSDNGETWEQNKAAGLQHDMLDRVIDLGNNLLVTTGHMHRGTAEQPAIRQAPAEQMFYRSDNGGQNWLPISVIARERNLVLCEASMTLLPDGRIAALMRENSFVYEPMYLCLSSDQGDTWSCPAPTPLIGHRPTLGMLPDGRLLVTYRNVAPDKGTYAWTGTLEELLSDFKIQGLHAAPHNPCLTSTGLHIQNGDGAKDVVRYALRPFTDPRSAKGTLEAEVLVNSTGMNGCGLRLGIWWHITPNAIIPATQESTPISIPSGQFNTIRIEYDSGTLTLLVNGEMKKKLRIEEDDANTRPVMFGAPYPFEDNSVDSFWKRVSQTMDEPRLQRHFEWHWEAREGFPDQWAQQNLLELQNDREAAPPDFGYSGWSMLPDGSLFCAYHHGGGTEKGYKPLFTSRVMGTRFYLDDFINNE